MSETPREGTKTQLALALAQGISVGKWARDNNVPRNTAYRWANDATVRKAVESCRRRALDQAIGRMTKNCTRAADLIVAISKEAESDSVRLRAARAIFSDVMAVSEYSGWEARLTELEEKLGQRKGAASSTAWSRTPASYGQVATPPAMPPAKSTATGAG